MKLEEIEVEYQEVKPQWRNKFKGIILLQYFFYGMVVGAILINYIFKGIKYFFS